MDTIIIVAAIFTFIIGLIIFILIARFALRKYYRVNDETLKKVQTSLENKDKILPLTFYLKSRGWGLSALRIPFGFGAGGAQQTASVELKQDSIVLTFIKREELLYSKLKLVDVYNLGVSLNIIFHVKGRVFTRYGNIVKKQLLVNVLKILKSKGVKLSKRAEKLISA